MATAKKVAPKAAKSTKSIAAPANAAKPAAKAPATKSIKPTAKKGVLSGIM